MEWKLHTVWIGKLSIYIALQIDRSIMLCRVGILFTMERCEFYNYIIYLMADFVSQTTVPCSLFLLKVTTAALTQRWRLLLCGSCQLWHFLLCGRCQLWRFLLGGRCQLWPFLLCIRCQRWLIVFRSLETRSSTTRASWPPSSSRWVTSTTPVLTPLQ